MIVERPGTLRAASSSADFTWADATCSRCSIGKGVRAPLSVTGSRPPSRVSATAPNSASGSSTRRIGRRLSEASPVKTVVIGVVATAPIVRRTPVPELPKSSTSGGSAKARRRRRHGHAIRRRLCATTSAPSLRIASAVLSTSSASRRPVIFVSPDGQSAQDQRAVRHGLVAGRRHPAFERAPLAGGQRRKLGGFIHRGTCPEFEPWRQNRGQSGDCLKQ